MVCQSLPVCQSIDFQIMSRTGKFRLANWQILGDRENFAFFQRFLPQANEKPLCFGKICLNLWKNSLFVIRKRQSIKVFHLPGAKMADFFCFMQMKNLYVLVKYHVNIMYISWNIHVFSCIFIYFHVNSCKFHVFSCDCHVFKECSFKEVYRGGCTEV